MKRLLVGMLLLTSFSLACDAPYEEIQGVKIGCEFTGGDGFNKVELKGAWGANSYGKNKDVKFFDSIQVEADKNNNIIGLSFIKNYPITLNNMEIQEKKVLEDFKKMTESLEKRWGKFDKTEAKDIYRSLRMDGAMFMSDVDERVDNDAPKSEVLGKIRLGVKYKNDDNALMNGKKQNARLILIYLPNQTAADIEKKAKSELEGF